MKLRIEADLRRFKQIRAGLARRELKRYFHDGIIPLPRPDKDGSLTQKVRGIEIPRFRYDGPRLGQGDWDDDKPLNVEEDGVEIQFDPRDASSILQEHFQLPRLRQLFQGPIRRGTKRKWASVGGSGVRVARTRTFLRALKRTARSGKYRPGQPIIVRKEDKVFLRRREVQQESSADAVVIYVMDKTVDDLNFFKNLVWWASAWIQENYPGLKEEFVVYETFSWNTNRRGFFESERERRTPELLDAYMRIADIMNVHGEETDIYVVHLASGSGNGLWTDEIFERLHELPPSLDWIAMMPRDLIKQFAMPLTYTILPGINGYFVVQVGNPELGRKLNSIRRKTPEFKRKMRVRHTTKDKIEQNPRKEVLTTLRKWFASREKTI